MTVLAQSEARRPSGWLRSAQFDSVLVGGVLAFALLLGAVAMQDASLFAAVLLVDVWLLAYPHVASSFSRIAFDRASARSHWRLLVLLPPVVLAGTAGVAWMGGAIALNTVYFYFQTYHYTKQSYGIARAYRRSAGEPGTRRAGKATGAGGRDVLADVVVFAFPAWGLLHRAHQQHAAFYNLPLYSPAVPRAVVVLAGAVALTAGAVWAHRTWRDLAAGKPVLGYAAYVASHVAITVVSYLVIDDITRGWLFVNVWHNAQYLLFVWAANARRFESGVDASRPFVSWLSQRENVVAYALVCGGVGIGFYLALGAVTSALVTSVLPVVLVVYLAVNFHHYIVDAVIWRAPRGRSTA